MQTEELIPTQEKRGSVPWQETFSPRNLSQADWPWQLILVLAVEWTLDQDQCLFKFQSKWDSPVISCTLKSVHKYTAAHFHDLK